MVFCMRLKYIDLMGGGRKDDSVYHLLDAARLLFCKSMLVIGEGREIEGRT